MGRTLLPKLGFMGFGEDGCISFQTVDQVSDVDAKGIHPTKSDIDIISMLMDISF